MPLALLTTVKSNMPATASQLVRCLGAVLKLPPICLKDHSCDLVTPTDSIMQRLLGDPRLPLWPSERFRGLEKFDGYCSMDLPSVRRRATADIFRLESASFLFCLLSFVSAKSLFEDKNSDKRQALHHNEPICSRCSQVTFSPLQMTASACYISKVIRAEV